MMQDYQDLQRCTRKCSATEREIGAGESYYSVLLPDGSGMQRRDYCEAAWQGPPAEAIGWWKSRLPAADSQQVQWAPNEVMLQYFEQLGDRPEHADEHFLLALLLVRRRILRIDSEQTLPDGRLMMYLSHAESGRTFEALERTPAPERLAAIERKLKELLFPGLA